MATALAGVPAAAQDMELRWCDNQGGAFSADQQIGGCTAFIQSGNQPARVLAIAFANRGHAFDSKGQYDRANQD